jgi:hypothetical protein
LDQYFQMQFWEAKQMFENLVKLWDEPSKVYVDRCEKLLHTPLQPDWDGVWNMTDK